MYDIACQLIRRGHNVSVYTTDAYEKNKRIAASEDNINGINVRYFRNISNYLAWGKKKFLPLSLSAHLKKTVNEYDVIHFSAIRNYLNLVSYPVIKKAGIPYVIDAHGSLPVATRQLKKIALLYDRFFVRPFIKDAKILFAQTSHERAMYEQLGGENISLMPLAINMKNFTDLPKKGRFREKHKISNEDRVITFLGRISKHKGISLLIDIFERLAKEMDKLKLVIAGRDDGYLAEVKNIINKKNLQDNVIFTGSVYDREKLSVYVDSDLFLFTPEYWEETSIASLEAMACYTPAIVSKQAEIPWLEDNEAGFMVDIDNNTDEVVRCITEFLSDRHKLETYSRNARKFIEDRFTIEKLVDQIESAYKAMIGEKT